jgi:muramoyltetrapeptide carboxypeptidase
MVAVEMAGGAAALDWEEVLRGGEPTPHAIAPENVLAGGRAAGPLVGGCLSLLASLCGTPEEIRGEDAILFWEDTGEDTYRLDRMLTQLERSGAFDGLRGMVIGSVVPRRDGESAEAMRSYLRERFAGAPFPAAMGLSCGHVESPRTLPLGAAARLDCDGRRELSFSGAAVQ